MWVIFSYVVELAEKTAQRSEERQIRGKKRLRDRATEKKNGVGGETTGIPRVDNVW